MRRLDAKFLYVGDVLHGVGSNEDPKTRTLSNVVVRGDGLVDLFFEDGSASVTQCNSTFSIEAYTVPFEQRVEIRDDFHQTLRDSQRSFRASRGQA